MLIRIRREIFKPGEFDIYEEPFGLTKAEICSKYRLSSETTFFYNSKGECIDSDIISDNVVTVIQTPAEWVSTALTVIEIVAALGGLGLGIYGLSKAKKLEEQIANRKAVDPSYTYTVRGSTNQVRPNLPVGILLGRANVCGDMAGLPYSSYDETVHTSTSKLYGENQYIHQVFSLGYAKDSNPKHGGVVVEKHPDFAQYGYKLHIGDTPIDLYDDVNIDVREGDSELSPNYDKRIIEETVTTKLTNAWIQRSTATNTTMIKVGIVAPYGYYKATDSGDRAALEYNYVVQYRPTGSTGSWTAVTDPNTSGSMAVKSYMHMVTISVPAGQYDVQVKNTLYSDTPPVDVQNTLEWDVLQSYVTTNNNSAPILNSDRYTLLSMTIRGTDQINGYVDKLYAKCHLVCRTYTGNYLETSNYENYWTIPNDASSDVGTMNNPASVLLYVLTDPKINPRPLTADKIDWISLREWFKFCHTPNPSRPGEYIRDWSCNAWITEQMTIGELAQRICETGRARFTLNNGKYGVVIDNVTDNVSQLFTPRNAWNMREVREFSDAITLINTSFVNENTEVEENFYTYIDVDTNYITCKNESFANMDTLYKSESISLWGVTDPRQAQQLSVYRLLQSNRLVRTYTWDCSIESIASSVGDVVYLANDIFMFSLGYGRISSVITAESAPHNIIGVNIDEAVELDPDPNKSYGITVRDQYGSLYDSNNRLYKYGIDKTQSSERRLIFTAPVSPSVDLLSGNLFMYGYSSQEGKKVKIIEIKPSSNREASITAIDYIPEVYNADVDTILPAYVSNVSVPGSGTTRNAGNQHKGIQPYATPIAPTTVTQFNHGTATTPNTTGWTDTPLVPSSNTDFIWQRVGSYVPPQTPEDITDWLTYRVSGPAGEGGQSQYFHIKYSRNSSGSPMQDTPADYIGTLVDQNPQASTVYTDYTWSRFVGEQGPKGDDGTGVTISSKSIKYQNSTSGTVTPTGTWTDNPSPVLGQYTWTRTIVNYSDDTSTTAYSVAYAGTNGADGSNGSIVVVQYSKGRIDRPYAPVIVGYDATDSITITGTDTHHILGRNTWTSEQIDDSTLAEDEFIWMRIGSYIPPQTEEDIDNWRVTRLTGADGESAKVVNIITDKTTLIRDERKSGAQDINLIAEVSGYEYASVKWEYGSSVDSLLESTSGLELSFAVDYVTASPYIVRFALYDGLDQKIIETERELTISCVDQTKPHNALGLHIVPITETVDPDGNYYLEGDSYVLGEETTTEQKATIKVFHNGEWVDLNSVDRSDFPNYDATLEDSIVAVFNFFDDESLNHVVADNYDFYKQIVAKYISAVYIHVGKVIYGYSKNSRVYLDDPAHPVGSRISGTGFILDSDGNFEFNDGYATNLNVRGVLNLYADDGQSIGANIIHPALTTVSGSASDIHGVEILQSNPTNKWAFADFVKATSSVARNTIHNGSITYNSGNTYTKFAIITDNTYLYRGGYRLEKGSTNNRQVQYYYTITENTSKLYKVEVRPPRNSTYSSGTVTESIACAELFINGTKVAQTGTIGSSTQHSYSTTGSSIYPQRIIYYDCNLPKGTNIEVRFSGLVNYGGGVGDYYVYLYMKPSVDYEIGLNSLGYFIYNNNESTWLKLAEDQYPSYNINMVSPVTFNSQNYYRFREVSNYIDYRYFYFLTSDSVIDASKTYYTRNSGATGWKDVDFTRVASPSPAYLSSYYERQQLSKQVAYQLIMDESIIYYEGNRKEGNFFQIESDNTVSIRCTDSTLITLNREDYYDVYGVLKLQGTSAGVKMMSIYPKIHGQYDIGIDDIRWRNAFFSGDIVANLYRGALDATGTFNGTGSFIGAVNTEATKNTYDVWGAVFN